MSRDFDLQEFERIEPLEDIEEETTFIKEVEISEQDLQTTSQLETQLNNLRKGQAGYDEALRELIEARMKNFYKTKGMVNPPLPISEFAFNRDGLLYHKETNTILEYKRKGKIMPYAMSNFKKASIRQALKISQWAAKDIPPKTIKQMQNVKETLLKASVTENVDTVANELNAEISSLSGSEDVFELREIRGLNNALQRIRGELINNLAKLTEIDNEIAHQKEKLVEASAEGITGETREAIKERIRQLEEERKPRIEAASATRSEFRTQVNRIRETIERVLNEDTTLAERIRVLFQEQGITIASILTALGFIISTIVLAVSPTVVPTISPVTPSTPIGSDAKDWIKKQLHKLADMLKTLAGKAVEALPGILGAAFSWLLNLLGGATVWLAEHMWALVVGVVVLVVTFINERFL